MNKLKWFIGKADSYISMKRSISNMEWVDIEVSGEDSRKVYEELFHCKIKNKDYIDKQRNIALLAIPDTYEDFIQGKPKQALRTNINKSKKNGYFCKYFNGIEYIDSIMEINLSSEERGGREMEKKYTDRLQVETFLNTAPLMYGAFTSDNKLIGYIQILNVNKMFVTNKILGHKDYLENGIMYYMISQLVQSVIDEGIKSAYIMYAKFLVGRSHAGYTYFKERSGFKGCNIRFHLKYST